MAENQGGASTLTYQRVNRLNIKFDDTTAAGATVDAVALSLGAISAGSYVINIQAIIRVAFDSGTTDVLDIGVGAFGSTVADPNEFVAAADVSAAAGEITLTKLLMGVVTDADVDVPLTATWTAAGTAATAGEVEILVYVTQL